MSLGRLVRHFLGFQCHNVLRAVMGKRYRLNAFARSTFVSVERLANLQLLSGVNARWLSQLALTYCYNDWLLWDSRSLSIMRSKWLTASWNQNRIRDKIFQSDCEGDIWLLSSGWHLVSIWLLVFFNRHVHTHTHTSFCWQTVKLSYIPKSAFSYGRIMLLHWYYSNFWVFNQDTGTKPQNV